MGIKPLYIARRGEDLLFGSELKTIFVHPEVERRLSPAALDCYLSLNYVPCPLDAGRGHRAASAGRISGMARRQDSHRSLLEAAAAAAAACARWKMRRRNSIRCCEQSVREHLLSDVPLGVWLSGGIDSSTILHYAAQASRFEAEDIFDFVSAAAASMKAATSARSRAIRHRARTARSESGSESAGCDRGIRLLRRRTECRCRRPAGLVPVQNEQDESRPSRSAARAATNFLAAISPIARIDLRKSLARGCLASLRAAGARGLRALAGFGRQDQLRIQAEALSRRLPDAPEPRARLLERHFLRRTESDAGTLADCPAALDRILGESARGSSRRRRFRALSLVRSEIFPSRRHSEQSGSHEHGPRRGSAPAVSRPPHRGICGHPAVRPSRFRARGRRSFSRN